MDKLKAYWGNILRDISQNEILKRKEKLMKVRKMGIVGLKGHCEIYEKLRYDSTEEIRYQVHLSILLKGKERVYIEELIIPMELKVVHKKVANHEAVSRKRFEEKIPKPFDFERIEEADRVFNYDRLEAVRYAERWWNDYNPNYPEFAVDCTNYVSQCLKAGGAPMRGAPDRNRGWWYRDKNNGWSYSWSVAHSMRWYLSGSLVGLTAKEVLSPKELKLGDVICYDFEGDGKWDHTTIVTAKDENNMPLVNAHTNNSRHRYWSYEDSLAWTENCRYKFFQISST